jgi:hypothetical protein
MQDVLMGGEVLDEFVIARSPNARPARIGR